MPGTVSSARVCAPPSFACDRHGNKPARELVRRRHVAPRILLQGACGSDGMSAARSCSCALNVAIDVWPALTRRLKRPRVHSRFRPKSRALTAREGIARDPAWAFMNDRTDALYATRLQANVAALSQISASWPTRQIRHSFPALEGWGRMGNGRGETILERSASASP